MNKILNPQNFPTLIGYADMINGMRKLHENSTEGSYPPYNVISLDNDKFEIELAVAGFGESDLSVTLDRGVLRIDGNVSSQEATAYIHKGISTRKFSRTFTLNDHIVVKGASVKHGLLTIALDRELPEELKPQTIDIDFKV